MPSALLLCALFGTTTGEGCGTNGTKSTDPGSALGAAAMVFLDPSDFPAGLMPGSLIVRAVTASGSLATTFTQTVTISIPNSPTGPNAVLSGQLSVAAVGGVATFTGLTETTAGSFAFTATSAGLPSITSKTFNVTPGAAASIGFLVQPSNAKVASVMTPPVIVAAFDQYMNVATGYVGTLGVQNSSSLQGISGTTAVVASGGKGMFGNLSYSQVCDPCQMRALGAITPGALSVVFHITQ